MVLVEEASEEGEEEVVVAEEGEVEAAVLEVFNIYSKFSQFLLIFYFVFLLMRRKRLHLLECWPA